MIRCAMAGILLTSQCVAYPRITASDRARCHSTPGERRIKPPRVIRTVPPQEAPHGGR